MKCTRHAELDKNSWSFKEKTDLQAQLLKGKNKENTALPQLVGNLSIEMVPHLVSA